MPNEPNDRNNPASAEDVDAAAAVAGVTNADIAPERTTPDDFARRLTDELNRVDRDMSHPNQEPRDAATLIVIDRAGDAPKVLLGRRHTRHKFMPGKFVFPGGRVEVADRRVGAANEFDARVSARLMAHVRRPSPAKARAFAIAAIRETFEETGLMLGVAGVSRDGAGAGDAPWAQFAAQKVCPDLAAMHFIARAITPPRRPRRFDTRFFAIDAQAIASRIEGVVGPDAELVELVWLPLAEAEQLDIPPITKAVLGELEHRIACGFDHRLPVPLYRWIGRRFTRTLLD
ncbi:MAG: NUDIX domain-containing protein [Xanthobacteraceae bacterium]